MVSIVGIISRCFFYNQYIVAAWINSKQHVFCAPDWTFATVITISISVTDPDPLGSRPFWSDPDPRLLKLLHFYPFCVETFMNTETLTWILVQSRTNKFVSEKISLVYPNLQSPGVHRDPLDEIGKHSPLETWIWYLYSPSTSQREI
jgi:hypothetical protein